VQLVPYALQNASHSAALFRQAATAPFSAPGILGVGELAVTQQSSPNMSIQLGAGRAMVAGTYITPPSGLNFTTQGMYFVLNDAPVTLTVSAADATNPRIDVVYVQVQDSFYSGSNNQTIAGIVTGTPAASPTVPAVPSNALAIAQISVTANATAIQAANISMIAPYAETLNRVLGKATGPAASTDSSSSVAMASVTVNVVAGQTYLVSGMGQGQRVTSAGAGILSLFAAGSEIERISGASTDQIASQTPISGSGWTYYTATTTGPVTFAFQVNGLTGAARFGANSCQIKVEVA